MNGRTVRTPEKGARLIKQLGIGKSVSAACRVERIGRTTYYAWRAADPDFAAAADEAIEQGTDFLEDKARDRAIKESDTLLIFLLKARRPEKYRERSETKHVGADGGDLIIRYVNDWRNPIAPLPPASSPPDDTIPDQ